MTLVLSLLLGVLPLSNGLPVPAVQQDSQSSALYYLMKYGYIHEDENSNTAALLSADGVKSAIKDFQVRIATCVSCVRVHACQLKKCIA